MNKDADEEPGTPSANADRMISSIAPAEYIAGVCNIGREEIARRRTLGWVGLAITFALILLLVRTGVHPIWRLTVFFPAALSASGFLQAYFHFCSGFAQMGVYNFGPPGQMQKIADEPSVKKDKRRGNRIALSAAVIGAAVAVVSAMVI